MTKIDIISGFLGAGKTTLIKKLIEQAFKGEKLVLIENEFGEIGIDGGFLKDAGVQTTCSAFWPGGSTPSFGSTPGSVTSSVWPG